MILYKYYNFESGKIALDSERVGFRSPQHFNDPFEASLIEGKSHTGDLVKNIRDAVAILSLTRDPLNPLMWAHYGDEHKGFVIGYEVKDPFFQCEKSNLIPVQKGNIIYTKTKPFIKTSTVVTTNLCNTIEGLHNEGDLKSLELINHLFLNKDTIWSYEEEVRIVKRTYSAGMEMQEFFGNPYNRFQEPTEEISPGYCKIKIPGLKIYDYQVRIKEVYLGERNPILENRDQKNLDYLAKIQKKGRKIYSVSVDSKSWNLIKTQLSH